jgi:anti-anti-sigma factor
MELVVTEHVVRVVVVAPQDRIDAVNAPQLRQRLHGLLDDGAANLVVDLSAVPFMDSAGMAVLVSGLKRARLAGGDVKLVWPQVEPARRILNLTRLDRVFAMADSAAEAVKGF